MYQIAKLWKVVKENEEMYNPSDFEMFRDLCRAKGLSEEEIERLVKELDDVWDNGASSQRALWARRATIRMESDECIKS
jgi:hypothetical protein